MLASLIRTRARARTRSILRHFAKNFGRRRECDLSTITMVRVQLSEKQWSKIDVFLRSERGAGRPAFDDRRFVEAVLWWRRTGVPWRDLPSDFGPRCTGSLGSHSIQGKSCPKNSPRQGAVQSPFRNRMCDQPAQAGSSFCNAVREDFAQLCSRGRDRLRASVAKNLRACLRGSEPT